MRNYTQSRSLIASFSLAVLLSFGCGRQENAGQIRVAPRVDTSPEAKNLSPTEAKQKGARGLTNSARPSGYPAPGR
jgi:hypothetical protein